MSLADIEVISIPGEGQGVAEMPEIPLNFFLGKAVGRVSGEGRNRVRRGVKKTESVGSTQAAAIPILSS